MSKMIEVRLNEVGANRSLFGDPPRRLREQQGRGDHRDSIADAVAQCLREGEYEKARDLIETLEEMDNGAGRGETPLNHEAQESRERHLKDWAARVLRGS
jgi:hypothetical protein